MSGSNSEEENETHFRLEGVSLRFPQVEALSDVSLRISASESVALIGPSGSGKSSLLSLLNGIYLPSSGRVESLSLSFADCSPSQARLTRQKIGWMPQDYGLVPNLRVLQNVISSRQAQHGLLSSIWGFLFPSANSIEEVHELLHRLEIGEKLYEKTSHLSGGQQQRVALARSLYQSPQVLLADEPVSSNDPARARNLLALLQNESQRAGMTLVCSLHDVTLAKQYFDRVVALKQGSVFYDGASEGFTESLADELFSTTEL